MKLTSKIGIVAALVMFALPTFAKEKSLDPIVVGKGMYTLKSEDSDFRVMEVTFKPGEKIGLHQHPKHMIFAQNAGTLTIHTEGKEATIANFKPGDVVIIPAEKHWAENTGTTPVTLLVVEMKGKN